MIHKHSLGYCLKCGKYRFFFPYGSCTEQKHDETINRMVHVRRREDDDSMVATHCLESLLLADTCTCSSLLPNERITIGRSLHCCVHREKRSRSSIQHCSQRRHRCERTAEGSDDWASYDVACFQKHLFGTQAL